MGPGPTVVEPRVYEALAKPIVSHVDPYFYQVAEDIRNMLGPLFGTQNKFKMVISGTGSAGMEAAIVNFTEPGTKFAVLAHGYFCDRISDIARRQGAQVARLENPGRDLRRRGSPPVHPPREAGNRGLRPGRNLHRNLSTR